MGPFAKMDTKHEICGEHTILRVVGVLHRKVRVGGEGSFKKWKFSAQNINMLAVVNAEESGQENEGDVCKGREMSHEISNVDFAGEFFEVVSEKESMGIEFGHKCNVS